MWQGWGITAETIYERDNEGLWLLRHGENVLRPLRILITPDDWDKDDLPWISLASNGKPHQSFRADKHYRRSVRRYFERLTEHLVMEAAQAPAIRKSKLHIYRAGKEYFHITIGDADFRFSFQWRRRGWTWTIRQWFDNRGLVVIDRIYRPHTENPIETFIAIISNIGLSFL
jgi:hypothetical protein